ncbi:aminoacyl-tRNA hydrolase [Candidatus Dojkabacteria bacterium]|nr:aminoacyl-tRNA hydrolase [Candidatus Dojkabacteria bacterium]
MSTEIFLFIGLGNPGKEYKNTRHNVGFMFLDYLIEKMNFQKFSVEEKFACELSINQYQNSKIILVKPQTFMNNSGETVVRVKNYYKIESVNIFVIHDDLDIEFPEYKLQYTKGPRQHNGLISIERHLGTSTFHKVRIGIENRGELRNIIPGKDYVLSSFSKEEIKILQNETFNKIQSNLISHISLG